MTVYITATFFSMFFATLAATCERGMAKLKAENSLQYLQSMANSRIFFAICSAVPMILVAALRHEVGTDWFIYSEHFESINNGGDSFSEMGFNLLNRIVYLIYPDFALMVVVCSVITYGFVFKAIYDQSTSYTFSILFFLLNSQYFNTMNQMRQMMAVAIFLYAMKYIKQRRLLMYLFWILLSCTLHTSAFMMIPLYFLYGFRISPLLHISSIIAGAILIIPLSRVAVFLLSKTSYGWYFDSIYATTTGFYLIGFVFSVILLMLFDFYYQYGDEKNDKDYNFMVNLYWIATLMVYLSASVPQSSRLAHAFVAPTILCLPKMLLREKFHHRRVVLTILVIVFFAVKLIYDIYQNNWYDVIPYQTIFSL